MQTHGDQSSICIGADQQEKFTGLEVTGDNESVEDPDLQDELVMLADPEETRNSMIDKTTQAITSNAAHRPYERGGARGVDGSDGAVEPVRV